MKTRIVALILTVVMSVLALTSCGSYNFAKEELTYASFNYDDFKAALKAIEIEDGDFTTNEETRKNLVASKIYNAVADKIIAATYESDRKTEGELGAGDVLYFVYFAKDAEGNTYFTSEMKESAITASSTKANHVIKLGETNEENELLKALKESLEKVDIKDYIYSMVTATDLTSDELAVKEGDVLVISYSRSYVKTEDGKELSVNESAAYETIKLDNSNAFLAKFLEEGAEAKIGSNLKAVTAKDEEGKVTTAEKFDVEMDGVKYTYSNVKIQWKVETEGKAIATFEYTPYESEKEDDKKEVTPDNLRGTSDAKINLMNKALTYYVYPVYAIEAPAFDEITASDVLSYVYGSSLKESSFEAFEDETYANGDKKIADLLKDVANIYDTKTETNEVYAEGTELKTLLDAYNDAVEAGGSNPTTEQQDKIDETKEALTKAQKKALDAVVEKIVACTNGTDNLGDVVLEKYNENTYHTLKEAYDNDITEKVQAAVWELIEKSVTVDTANLPAKLVKEYKDHLYESYEYEYYKGDFNSTTKNIDKYENLDAYLVATLKLSSIDKLDEALDKEAREYIVPIVKIFVVARACEADAVAVLKDYIEADIAGGAYNVNEESYRDAYGDKADEKIEEAKKNAEESIASAREEAGMFLVDDAYMKGYKKEVGRAYYKSVIEQYGEINLRAGFQFNRLFYYLTSTNIELNEDGTHTESVYKDGKLDFRTISYTIKAETDAE